MDLARNGPASPWRLEMASPEKVLITGASGLVGEGVLRRVLLDNPELEAFALIRDELRWQLASRRLGSLSSRVIPLRGDITIAGLGLEPLLRKRVERETRAVVHAAADISFSRSLDYARFVNTLGTYHVAEIASACEGMERFLFVSTAFVAGRATGTMLERDNGADAGWVNSYEQSKYEAEECIRKSGLPWTIVRPSTIVCRGAEGDIQQINAVHRALRIYHRGLAAMMPGDRSYPFDVVTSSYVTDAISRLTFDQQALCRTVHLCSGRNALTLGELVDTAYEVWAESPEWRRRGVERAIITDAATYGMFERAVMETGDVRLRSVLASLSHFIPQLALPKVFDTSVAESLLGDRAPAPGTYWMPMLRRLLEHNWGQTEEAAA
jgi:nucleoside-diphosphate-sugar epimerase